MGYVSGSSMVLLALQYLMGPWVCVHPVSLKQVQPGFSGSSQYFPTADKREFVFDGLRVSLVEETELSADVVSWRAVHLKRWRGLLTQRQM